MEDIKSVSRIDFIDAVRGVAAILVLVSHSLEWFVEGWSANYFEYINLGMIGVVAFFLVSGFVIPLSLEKYNSILKFAINRFFRIYPLYCFILFLTLMLYFINIAGLWLDVRDNILISIGINLFMLQEYLPIQKFNLISLVSSSWTLFIEIIWYFLFSIFYFLKWNKNHFKLILIAGSFLIFIASCSLLLNIRIPLGHLILLYCCFLGLLTYRYYNKEIDINMFIIISTISALVILFSLYVGFAIFKNPIYSSKCIFISYSLGIGLFAVFYVFNNYVVTKNKLLKFLGNISYSLYLVHTLILYLVKYFDIANTFINLFLVAFLSIICAYILYIYVEKVGMSFGKKLIQLKN